MRDTLGDGGAFRAATNEPHVDATQSDKLIVTSVYKAPITVNEDEYTSKGAHLTIWEIYAPADWNKLGCQVSWQSRGDMLWNAFLRKIGIRSDMNQMARIEFKDLKQPSNSRDGRYFGYKITSTSRRKCENACYVWFDLDIWANVRARTWFEGHLRVLSQEAAQEDEDAKEQAHEQLYREIILENPILVNGHFQLEALVRHGVLYNGKIDFILKESFLANDALRTLGLTTERSHYKFSLTVSDYFTPQTWSLEGPAPQKNELKAKLVSQLFPSDAFVSRAETRLKELLQERPTTKAVTERG